MFSFVTKAPITGRKDFYLVHETVARSSATRTPQRTSTDRKVTSNSLVEGGGGVAHQKTAQCEAKRYAERFSATLDVTNRRLYHSFVSTDLTRHLKSSVEEHRLTSLTLVDHLLHRWEPYKTGSKFFWGKALRINQDGYWVFQAAVSNLITDLGLPK